MTPDVGPAAADLCCRGCGSQALAPLLDLGAHPDPDALLASASGPDAPTAPIRAAICGVCGLVQLVGGRPPGRPSPHGHDPSGARSDDTWIQRLLAIAARERAVVIDVDATARGMASIFAEAGLPVIGFGRPEQRDRATAWLRPAPFDQSSALEVASGLAGPRLVVASHALGHVDDLRGLVAAMDTAIGSDGYLAAEFHHVLGLADGQFDVLNHAHRSYLSLHALESLLARHNIAVVDAERTAQFGGTLRVIARRSPVASTRAVAILRRLEADRDLADPEGYGGLAELVERTSNELVTFLDRARRAGRRVVGYGAGSRGTTLLNIAGIRPGDLMFVADRSPSKQGRFLPRSRLPVVAPAEIDRSGADDILVLPGPIATDVIRELSDARARRARFIVAMPRLTILS